MSWSARSVWWRALSQRQTRSNSQSRASSVATARAAAAVAARAARACGVRRRALAPVRAPTPRSLWTALVRRPAPADVAQRTATKTRARRTAFLDTHLSPSRSARAATPNTIWRTRPTKWRRCLLLFCLFSISTCSVLFASKGSHMNRIVCHCVPCRTRVPLVGQCSVRAPRRSSWPLRSACASQRPRSASGAPASAARRRCGRSTCATSTTGSWGTSSACSGSTPTGAHVRPHSGSCGPRRSSCPVRPSTSVSAFSKSASAAPVPHQLQS